MLEICVVRGSFFQNKPDKLGKTYCYRLKEQQLLLLRLMEKENLNNLIAPT